MRKLLWGVVLLTAGLSGLASAAPQAKFGTGENPSGYYRVSAAIANGVSKTNIHLQEFTGSGTILECFNEQECQLAIVQKDALNLSVPTFAFGMKSVYEEAGSYYYNIKIGDKDFGSLEDDKEARVAVVIGSGAAIMMDNFIATDDDYAHLPLYFDDTYDAMDAASEGSYIDEVSGKEVKVVGYFAVHRDKATPQDIREDFSRTLGLGEINDRSFKKAKDVRGKPLYTPCNIDAVPGITEATIGTQNSLCVQAVILTNKKAFKGKAKKEIKKTVNRIVKTLAGKK